MKKLQLLLLFLILISCNGQSKGRAEKRTENSNNSGTVANRPVEKTDGIIYFSANNGLTWENKSEGLPDSIHLGLRGIAVSENSLAIATKEAGIFHYDFHHNVWINIPVNRQITESDPNPLAFFKHQIVVGTQFGGIFSTTDNGKTWLEINTGLASLNIRKLLQVENKLYAGTNAGLYSFNEALRKWELEYGNSSLQVNGITTFKGNLYIGTNQGAFTSSPGKNEWKQILANCSLHNISSDDNTIYVMVYNKLLSSDDGGQTWKNIQKGLPAELYTFDVIRNGNSVFAAQWDGVYRKDRTGDDWNSYSTGLPPGFAIANMNVVNGIIVVGGNIRNLKKGYSTRKNIFK